MASTVLSKSSAGDARVYPGPLILATVVLADLAKGRMRSKIPALTDALRGKFRSLPSRSAGTSDPGRY